MSSDSSVPMISVILPVFNREVCIRRASDSILRQTCPDWELIIIDDGSTDNTGRICDDYARSDSRIKVIHTKNSGVYHARNTGLENSSGTWIVFLDSDDEYAEDAFEVMLGASENADIVIGATLILPQNELRGLDTENAVIFAPSSALSCDALMHRLYDVIHSRMYRGELLNGMKFDDSLRVGADSIFSAQLLPAARLLAFVPNRVYYRHNDTNDNLTLKFNTSRLHSYRMYYELISAEFADQSVTEWISKRYSRLVITFFYSLLSQPGMNELVKTMVVQSQLDENVAPAKVNVSSVYLSPLTKVLWNSVCAGDAGELIHVFEDNRDKYFSKELDIR